MRITQMIAYSLRTGALGATLGILGSFASAAQDGAFIPRLVNSSTIPANGDLNPYGVAFVPEGFPAGGTTAARDVLVSNFNSSSNLQGTGTTIVKLTPVRHSFLLMEEHPLTITIKTMLQRERAREVNRCMTANTQGRGT